MIRRGLVRALATVIAAVLYPFAVWDQWQARHSDPWATDE